MPTEKTEETTVNYTGLNVMQKLQIARVKFLNAGVTKSGKHIKLEYLYFELKDIVPAAENIFAEVGLLMIPILTGDTAIAKVYNVDDTSEDPIIFEAPFVQNAPIVSNAGKEVTTPIQALGSSITYMRRYLWQLVLDIVETDTVDSGIYDDDLSDIPTTAPKAAKKAPATPKQRQEIKEELTDTSAPADELQVKALKAVLKKLLELDSEQESFVQSIALKTDGFQGMTKETCEGLINGIGEMMTAYDTQEA